MSLGHAALVVPFAVRLGTRDHGIELEDTDQARVYELCRYLAAVTRDSVLATSDERRGCIAPEMQQLLVLDDWHHPELANGQRPSEVESFQQLAGVLAAGDVDLYRPTRPGNTHWRNWPESGTL